MKFGKFTKIHNHKKIHWAARFVFVLIFGTTFCLWSAEVAPTQSHKQLGDDLALDLYAAPFTFPATGIEKTILLKNTTDRDMAGLLEITAKKFDSGETFFSENEKVELRAHESREFSIVFPAETGATKTPSELYYKFTEKKSGLTLSQNLELPYFRTPPPSESPKINGPTILGARPDHPLLFLIPTTGQRPIEFSAAGLPEGLQLDSSTGILSGAIQTIGEYQITLAAQNEHGRDVRPFKILIGDKLALTPPMGWNSWYIHYHRVSDKIMREAADQMIASGMANYGYNHVNIDDCWMVKVNSENPEIGGPTRDAHGKILANKRFPEMKALTDYIHAKGLKAGIYISPGPQTCGGYEGSYGHESLDAETFAEWGFDFLKYDWCSYGKIARSEELAEFKKPYQIMWQNVQTLNRDIILNLCQYGMGEVWKWGGEVGHCWRTTGDLGLERSAELPGFYNIGFSNAQHWEYAKPGAWNDPDYILIGWVGSAHEMGEGVPTSLTASEQYSYMSMWCLMAAPLIFSGDMARLDAFTLNVLCNSEVIAIDQDPLGKQAHIISKTSQEMVMVKDLEDGSKAIGLFNLSENTLDVAFDFRHLQVDDADSLLVRDLWCQQDVGKFARVYRSKIPRHGVDLVRVNRPESE